MDTLEYITFVMQDLAHQYSYYKKRAQEHAESFRYYQKQHGDGSEYLTQAYYADFRVANARRWDTRSMYHILYSIRSMLKEKSSDSTPTG